MDAFKLRDRSESTAFLFISEPVAEMVSTV